MVLNITKQNFESEVVKSDIPVILDFWAEWCMPCKMMGPVFEDVSKEYVGKLKFGKVNTETDGEIASKFGIQGIPSLVIVKDGKEIDRIVGFSPAPVLKEKIDAILNKI